MVKKKSKTKSKKERPITNIFAIIDLYKKSIQQVPRIVKRLRIRGYEFMTAAECLQDDEPHDRDNRALLVNAQNVEPELKKEEKQADSVSTPVQESSANSFNYPFYLTFVLAIVGFSGYFI